MRQLLISFSIRIYVNEIENIITFKLKAWYYVKPLTAETLKLVAGTKSEKAKNENGKCDSFRKY